jgi:hypothetical protein
MDSAALVSSIEEAAAELRRGRRPTARLGKQAQGDVGARQSGAVELDSAFNEASA